eukprot:COSAG02_NODE_1951_length_10286_cov_4.096005_5_plen_79_part_00
MAQQKESVTPRRPVQKWFWKGKRGWEAFDDDAAVALEKAYWEHTRAVKQGGGQDGARWIRMRATGIRSTTTTPYRLRR